MTQANESLGLTAADHIRVLYQHAGLPFLDYVLINQEPVSLELRGKYAMEGAAPVLCDEEAIEALGVRTVKGTYVAEGEVARHAAERLAPDLLNLTCHYHLFNDARLSLTQAVNC